MKNKNVKKLLALLFAGMLGTVCLAGCGEESAANENDGMVLSGEIEVGSTDAEGESKEETVTEETTEPFTMFFAGDVMLGNGITNRYDNEGLNGVLSDDLIAEMQNADLCMINQEFPFGVGGTQAPDKQYTFKTDPEYVQAFLDMGVDIVSLANNHVLDYGPDVLSQSFVTLDEADIDYVGAGETIERAKAWESYELGGTSVAVLSASRVIPVVEWNVDNAQPGVFCTYDPTQLIEQIKLAEEEHDLTVVYVHWGVERKEYPEEYQRELARQYIDAGADLVVGGHAHVIQGVEYYNGVPIVYSLGNYMFNQSNKPTAALKVYVDENQNLSLQMIPVASSNYKTYATEGLEKADMINYIETLSYDLSLDEEGYVCPSISDEEENDENE